MKKAALERELHSSVSNIVNQRIDISDAGFLLYSSR